MLSSELLSLLCCPETHQELRPADPKLLEELNRKITAGIVQSRGGKPVTERLQAGLVRTDGKFLYPIRDDIPVMLIEEAVPLP